MLNSAGFSFLVFEVKISLFSTNVYAKSTTVPTTHMTNGININTRAPGAL